MTKDYCEILLDSVRAVVDVEVAKAQVEADHIEICTIIDNGGSKDDPAIAYYWVQNESGQRYQVNSTLTDLRLNDQIYVSVLANGTGRTVLGRKLSDANLPITTVEAFERFFSLESWKDEKSHTVSLVEGYTRLGIECIVDNSKAANPLAIGEIKLNLILTNDSIYTVSFSTEDMLGDPANFYGLLQKKVFNIANLREKIKQINCETTDNRFSDIVVSLGYDLDSLQEETPLYLYTNDSKEYKTDINSNFISTETAARTLAWRWIYTDENGKLQGLSSADETPDGYNYYLYEYNEDNDTGDMYGGLNWQKFDTYTLGVSLNSQKEENKYKLIITYNGTHIVSNELVFVNKQQDKPTAIQELKFKFSDNSNGQYPYYEYDGYLSEIYMSEAYTERTVTAQFVKEENAIVKKIIWTVPIDLITITKAGTLTFTPSEQEEVIEVVPTNTEDVDFYSLEYKIKEYSYFAENDQYLKCTIYVEEEDAPYSYEQQIVLRVDGANGTDNYVIVRFYDGRGNLKHSITPGETARLEVRAYNGDGVEITDDIIAVEYTWLGQRQKIEYDEFGNVALDENGNEKERGELLLPNTQSGTTFFEIYLPTIEENADVSYLNLCPIIHLDVQFKGETGGIVLTKDLTLPVRYKDDYSIYRGPSIIQYAYDGGSPKCARTKPSLLDAKGEPAENINWYLVTNDNFSGYPEFNQETQYLNPKSSYDSQFSINEKRDLYLCNLIGYKGNAPKLNEDTGIYELTTNDITEVYWAQPILIIQSRYFSTIIDNWDGAMEINEDGNYILASIFAAGNKNEYNQFSGVMMGTFGTLIDSEDNSTETGIKGFKDGMQVYELNDSGQAIFGPSGSGQIQFDGWSGTIRSGGFDGQLDETANKVVVDVDKIGTQGSYWNLNTGEFITNDGYFRGSLYADKLFINDEVKEESGILSTARFETYADAEKAIFESEVEYLTYTADTQKRANAAINSFVDEQQAINSMQASYSFDKSGIPTDNYQVMWEENNSTGPLDKLSMSHMYDNPVNYCIEKDSQYFLFNYDNSITEYIIIPDKIGDILVTGIYGIAFKDVSSSLTVYYPSTIPSANVPSNSDKITYEPITSYMCKNDEKYPRMQWKPDNKYYYKEDLWYYDTDKWLDNGELYQDIVDIKNNSRIETWDIEKRYRCQNFYTYKYSPLTFSWTEEENQTLPEGEFFYDPGEEKRILNYDYYSSKPTKLAYNGKEYTLAPEEVNSKLHREFFRNGGGAYWYSDMDENGNTIEGYRYWTSENTSVLIETSLTYYSNEYSAYYRYVKDTTNDFKKISGWIRVSVVTVSEDPTKLENLGKWNPKNVLYYITPGAQVGKYYAYDFRTNQWVKKNTLVYTKVENIIRSNKFNDKTSYIFLEPTKNASGETEYKTAVIHSDCPKGEWQLFRLPADETEYKFKYTKYTANNIFNPKEEIIGSIPKVSELNQETFEKANSFIVSYNQEYYILGSDENTPPIYNFYKLKNKEDLIEYSEHFDADIKEDSTSTGKYLEVYNYQDRLCTYPKPKESTEENIESQAEIVDITKWDYSKVFDTDDNALKKTSYRVDQDLIWKFEDDTSQNPAIENAKVYHVFDTDRIYKVGEAFYEYDEKLGWHKIKTAAATSASLVQWANAAGAQSALTTQFVAGLNKNIVAVPSFKAEDYTTEEQRKNCYYDLTEGKYWVWDNRKWVEYEPSMSTSAQIKQTANEAMAQIALIANYDITVEEIETGSWSEQDKDLNNAYYVKSEDKTYLYIEKEEAYDNYIAIGYEFNPTKAEPFASGWYSIKGKLQRSISSITQRATGLESRMSLTVGYGDNADLKQYVATSPTDLADSYTNYTYPCIIYIVKDIPAGSDLSFNSYKKGYYYAETSDDVWDQTMKANWFETLPDSITDSNGKTIKIPQMAGISMAADAAGGSIDFIFGPAGEGHILELQENGDVYLKAKNISFAVGGTMVLTGDEADYPIFSLQAAYKDNNNIAHPDSLSLGGAIVKNGYIEGNRYYLANWIGYEKSMTNWTGPDGLVIENMGSTVFSIYNNSDGTKTSPLVGFTQIGEVFANNIYSKSLIFGKNLKASAEIIIANTDTLIDGTKVRANNIVCPLTQSSSTDGYIKGFYITDCEIPDYLKKNDLTASLTSVTLAKQSDFVENGTDGPVTYYSLISENLPNSTSIGKITYNGNNYYLVNDVSSNNKVPGYTKTAIQVPLLNSGYYYTISSVSQVLNANNSPSGVEKITVFDWGTSAGAFYRGSLSTLSTNNYINSTTSYTYKTYELGDSIKQENKTYYLVTEKEVTVNVPYTFNVYISASYTVGNSSISIDRVW